MGGGSSSNRLWRPLRSAGTRPNRRSSSRCAQQFGHILNLSLDYQLKPRYRIRSLAHRGASSRDDPEGGAGRGVLRRPLAPGGPGSRPPGTTTWLRGARCTDPEVMPETEARPRVKNRHGGAPRGERPASWDARRLARRLAYRVMIRPTGASHAPERFSALRPPLDSG